ncbi:hypothetical protein QBC39DRAFT_354623 [Podospora conica]|nr:hypothetical protein QBC39DRAFT_354623 [Schizothecium conicum]
MVGSRLFSILRSSHCARLAVTHRQRDRQGGPGPLPDGRKNTQPTSRQELVVDATLLAFGVSSAASGAFLLFSLLTLMATAVWSSVALVPPAISLFCLLAGRDFLRSRGSGARGATIHDVGCGRLSPWCEVTRAACSFSGQVNLGMGGLQIDRYGVGTSFVCCGCILGVVEYFFLPTSYSQSVVHPQAPRASRALYPQVFSSHCWE